MSWRDWPFYSEECKSDLASLLVKGKRLTAYRANPKMGVGPEEESWAWRAERLAEEIHKIPHVVLCQSGTQALTVLLRVLQPSSLTTTGFTFSATLAAMLLAGCSIRRLVDVSLPDMTSEAELAVDLFGKQNTHSRIADSCQAVGLPPFADHGVWSFNGRKNVPAGEGGAIYTIDGGVAAKCRLMLNHGENFGFAGVGENGHVNEQTACLIYHGLKAVEARNFRRRKLAEVLRESIAHERATYPDLRNHALYVYPLIIDRDNEGVATRLREKGVDVQVGYIQPTLDEYPAFMDCEHDGLLNTYILSKDRLLVFPQVVPTATEDEMVELGQAIREALN